jgi:hypothetical protein
MGTVSSNALLLVLDRATATRARPWTQSGHLRFSCRNRAEQERCKLNEHSDQSPMGRRTALRRLAALSGAAVAGAAVLREVPAGATTGAMQFGANNNAGTDSTGLSSTHPNSTLQVFNGTAAPALTAISYGLCAHVYQNPSSGPEDALRVQKNSSGAGAGLRVLVTAGAGAGAGIRVTSTAVGIESEVTQGSGSAVKATANGTGPAVRAQVTNPASAAQAVRGDTNGTGYGVFGRTTGTRAALGGDGGSTGRGAVLISNIAQLRLQPSTLGTHPSSGQAGDLFVDASKRLWFCRGGTAWSQVV